MLHKIILPLILVAACIQFGCKKNSSGPPSITSIRLIDSTKRDSVFNKAVPGTEIVIQGNNLDGVREIYFNDTLAYFNPVYVTSTHVIVTIPSSAPTAAANSSVPSQIKLVTDHGTAMYSFTLYLPPPNITAIALDNTGTMVVITGTNFQGIKKITFPVPGVDTALSYTVNKNFTQIMAAIPPGTAFKDSLRVYATYGVSAFVYPPVMIIKSVSNENAIAGTTLTFYGTNLIGISKVTFPGGIEGTDIQNISVTQFSVKVPAGIAAPDSVRIEGVLGTATAPQPFDTYLTHPSPGYLCTFDDQWASNNQGFVGWTGGYAGPPAADYPDASGGVAFLDQGSPMPGNSKPGTQGNPGFVQLNAFPWVSNTSLNIADYSLKFEVYVAKPWSAGAIWVLMGDWYGWKGYMARYAPWTGLEGGAFQPPGWVTATIPLTQFASFTGNGWDLSSFPTGPAATKFSDFTSTSLCFTITNDQSSPDVPASALKIGIDNIRIVKGQ